MIGRSSRPIFSSLQRRVKMIFALFFAALITVSACSAPTQEGGSKDAASNGLDDWETVLESNGRFTSAPLNQDELSDLCDDVYAVFTAEFGDTDQFGDTASHEMQGSECDVVGHGMVKKEVPTELWIQVKELGKTEVRSLATVIAETGGDSKECALTETASLAPAYVDPAERAIDAGNYCEYTHEENGIFEGSLLGGFVAHQSLVQVMMISGASEIPKDTAEGVNRQLLELLMPVILEKVGP